jgi:peptidoglycan/xylan/chitin deacetylase (PgdA/CDA1 family)
MTATRVPILTYHSLDDSGSVVSFPPRLFREQLRALAARGFTGLSLGKLLAGWDGSEALPARPFVLSFDDGFASVLEHAAPALAEVRFSATVFVVAGATGRWNDWPGAAGIPRMPLLSWSDLSALRGAGLEIAGHSMTHAWLPGLSPSRLAAEVVDSKRLIEDRLGAEVRCFAYPYGAHDEASLALVRAHHRAAVGVAMGTARQRSNRHLLPRLDAHYLRRPSLARGFGTLSCSLYLAARRAGRAARGVLVRAGIVPAADGGMAGRPDAAR